MARPQRRYVETEEYIRFLHRILRALGTRVGDADVEMLRGLADLPGLVEQLLAETVGRLRAEHGYSWADIGRALGVTRQAAQQRFGCQGGVDGRPGRTPMFTPTNPEELS